MRSTLPSVLSPSPSSSRDPIKRDTVRKGETVCKGSSRDFQREVMFLVSNDYNMLFLENYCSSGRLEQVESDIMVRKLFEPGNLERFERREDWIREFGNISKAELFYNDSLVRSVHLCKIFAPNMRISVIFAGGFCVYREDQGSSE